VLTSHGYEGTVHKLYDDFSAIAHVLGSDAEHWAALQEPALTSKERQERWYAVRIDSGGAVWAPESRLVPELFI
jgi:hypothetical protein